jgi:arylsulfatase A-like enzyme
MISNLDDNINRLMDYLEANDLEENTLIFFISDNGGAEYTLTTDNGRYDGGKNTEFEGGVKVPMIIRWKGQIQPGKRFDPMVSSLDIFSTALAAANIPVMPGREVDGVDLLPFLMDAARGNPHEYLFWKRGNSKVVRSNRWKLMLNGHSGDTLLYDLSKNRYEEPDEAAGHPEILMDLSRAFDAWTRGHKPPMWPPVVFYIGDKDGHPYYFDQ